MQSAAVIALTLRYEPHAQSLTLLLQQFCYNAAGEIGEDNHG
jgi:hypothetical protein